MINEVWKTVIGYEGIYEVSNKGRLKRMGYGVLKEQKNNKGYKRNGLWNNGICKFFSTHRLVAFAFIPNPEDKPFINHIDNNPENNSVENLEWCTRKENSEHCVRQGRQNQGEKQHSAKLRVEDILEIKSSTASGLALSKKYGVSDESIYKIRRGVTWKSVTA